MRHVVSSITSCAPSCSNRLSSDVMLLSNTFLPEICSFVTGSAATVNVRAKANTSIAYWHTAQFANIGMHDTADHLPQQACAAFIAAARRTWSTMGATWYFGDPSLRQRAHAASAWGTSDAGPGMRL